MLKVNCACSGTCKKCKKRACDRAYYLAHKEQYRIRGREWRKRNPEKVKASAQRMNAKRKVEQKLWRSANPDKMQAARRRWLVRNPEKARAAHTLAETKRGRAKAVGDLDAATWLVRVGEFNSSCAYCLKPVDIPEVEHMRPLSRGGSHTIENCVPSCSTCNRKKHTKTLLEYASELFLSPLVVMPKGGLLNTSATPSVVL